MGFWERIPHPEMGRYCGAGRKGQSKKEDRENDLPVSPVDAIDHACLIHDSDTSIWSDFRLVKNWLTVNPFNPAKYDRQVYGRLYQYLGSVVMLAVGVVSFPVRIFKKHF